MKNRELIESIKHHIKKISFTIKKSYSGVKEHGVPWFEILWVFHGKIVVYFNPELSSQGNHVGIILAQKPLIPSSILDDSMYGEGVVSLIYFFKSKKIAFKVYPCEDADSAETNIRKPNVKGLWIFGHGTKNSLSFGIKGKLLYSNLKNALPKDYIAQLHCNDGPGPSLLDLLFNGEGICSDGCRFMMQNRIMIREWIDNETNNHSPGYLQLKEHCKIDDN